MQLIGCISSLPRMLRELRPCGTKQDAPDFSGASRLTCIRIGLRKGLVHCVLRIDEPEAIKR